MRFENEIGNVPDGDERRDPLRIRIYLFLRLLNR